jgi:hypothetical protein
MDAGGLKVMYELVSAGSPLGQGDIFDDCSIYGFDPASPPDDLDAAPMRWKLRVVVLTQACDLAQQKATRVLVAVVHSAEDLVQKGQLKPSVIRDQIRRGRVFGWYFLPAATQGVTLPESVVDLHDLHTVPRAFLHRLVSDGKRICRMVTPYREHLNQHFAVTYSRIALPEPYETEP